jgi:hypothetical protein
MKACEVVMYTFNGVDARVIEVIEEAVARFIQDKGVHPGYPMLRAYHGDREAARRVAEFLENYLAPMDENKIARERFLDAAQMARTGGWKPVIDWYRGLVDTQLN